MISLPPNVKKVNKGTKGDDDYKKGHCLLSGQACHACPMIMASGQDCVINALVFPGDDHYPDSNEAK